jgi:hypothetical protein
MNCAIHTLGVGLRRAACELFGTPEARATFKWTKGRNGRLHLIDLADLDAAISRSRGQPPP